MPETNTETPGNSIAATTLSDRDLLIHAIQHLEDLTEKMGEAHGAVLRIDAELAVFRPLLAKLAPGGKPDFIAVMQARRDARK